MLSSEYMHGFRAAMDVVLEYFEGRNTRQEFCDKYGLKPKWGDSVMEEIRDHALAVAEIHFAESAK